MNLRTVFKAQSIVLLLNAIGGLFLTATFMAQANFEVTADLITLGQFLGMTFLVISIWSWRIPDIAGDLSVFCTNGLPWEGGKLPRFCTEFRSGSNGIISRPRNDQDT